MADRNNWLRNSTNFKGVNKATSFSYEQTCTLFCVTCQRKCFYWLVVHTHFNIFCVLCTVNANGQEGGVTKTYYNETDRVQNKFALLAMVRTAELP